MTSNTLAPYPSKFFFMTMHFDLVLLFRKLDYQSYSKIKGRKLYPTGLETTWGGGISSFKVELCL
jgi:hypothetical protein